MVWRTEAEEQRGLYITHCNLMLKVHKRKKFFVSDFEFFTILYLVKLKY